MATVRDTAWAVSGGSTSFSMPLPASQPGDTLVVIVGGGSRVTSVPSGWKYYQYQTGQEAQGIVLSCVVSVDNPATTIAFNFDGGDTRSVFAVSVIGVCEITFPYVDRFGVAGSTFAASSSGPVSFDAGEGDVLLSYVFARNATDVPGALTGGLSHSSSGSSSAAAWVEEIDFAHSATQGFTYPHRSGHFGIVVQLWEWSSRTAVEHEYTIVPTDVTPGATWDAETHTFTAPANEGGIYFYFDLSGDFTDFPIAGIRVDQHQIAGASYLNMAFDETDGPALYFAVDTSTIWQFTGAFDVWQPADYQHSITRAYTGGGFSVSEMVRRTAFTTGYNHGYGDLSWNYHDGSTHPGGVTTLRIIAYEAPSVIFPAMTIAGQLDRTRVRPYNARAKKMAR